MKGCVQREVNSWDHEPVKWDQRNVLGCAQGTLLASWGFTASLFVSTSVSSEWLSCPKGRFSDSLLSLCSNAPTIVCICEAELGSVNGWGCETGSGSYIIEAYSNAASCKGNSGSKEEPASHTKGLLVEMPKVQKRGRGRAFRLKLPEHVETSRQIKAPAVMTQDAQVTVSYPRKLAENRVNTGPHVRLMRQR